MKLHPKHKLVSGINHGRKKWIKNAPLCWALWQSVRVKVLIYSLVGAGEFKGGETGEGGKWDEVALHAEGQSLGPY